MRRKKKRKSCEPVWLNFLAADRRATWFDPAVLRLGHGHGHGERASNVGAIIVSHALGPRRSKSTAPQSQAADLCTT